MKDDELGRLERVDLREVWSKEADDFTPWLAQAENLPLVGETIGLELELEAQEKNVGPFRADLLCKDTATNSWVLIENQLERTDHSHLGQLLTYATGLEAVTIVWITARFAEEHRAALDWLNEKTDTGINFFGLEIELWKIGDSKVAPKLNMVSKPNDWTKRIASATKADLTPTKQLQLDYWSAFSEHLAKNGANIKPTKAAAQHWMTFAIGKSNCTTQASVNTQGKNVSVGLVLAGPYARSRFDALKTQREAIEAEIGQRLEWRKHAGAKESRIWLYKSAADPNDHSHWPEQHAWLSKTLATFDSAFRNRLQQIDVQTLEYDEGLESDNGLDSSDE